VLCCRARGNLTKYAIVSNATALLVSSSQSPIAQAATVWRHLAIVCSGEMRGVIVRSIVGLWLMMPAEAASITVNAPDAHGRIFVDVVGEIVAADEQALNRRSPFSIATLIKSL
jgi:hypothetical protein